MYNQLPQQKVAHLLFFFPTLSTQIFTQKCKKSAVLNIWVLPFTTPTHLKKCNFFTMFLIVYSYLPMEHVCLTLSMWYHSTLHAKLFHKNQDSETGMIVWWSDGCNDQAPSLIWFRLAGCQPAKRHCGAAYTGYTKGYMLHTNTSTGTCGVLARAAAHLILNP